MKFKINDKVIYTSEEDGSKLVGIIIKIIASRFFGDLYTVKLSSGLTLLSKECCLQTYKKRIG